MTDPRLENATCLVSGASGFIGSHLCDRLLAEGARVVALNKQVSRVLPPRLAHLAESIDIVEANLQDGGALRIIAERVRPRFVFHLGAYTHVGKSFEHVDESLQTNIAGTVNLLDALRAVDYETFVYAGTSEIYGGNDVPFHEDQPVSPLSPYSVAKYAGERYCKMFHDAYDWPVVMLRPFNAFGPRQSPDRIIPEVIVSALAGVDVAMTEGRQTREFNYVTDVVDGFVRAALAGADAHGQVINIGCGEEHSMRHIAELTIRLMGDPIRPRFGALPPRPTEIWRMFSDNSKARRLLGWEPQTALEDGLRTTIEFYTHEARRSEGSPFLLPGGSRAPAR